MHTKIFKKLTVHVQKVVSSFVCPLLTQLFSDFFRFYLNFMSNGNVCYIVHGRKGNSK